MTLQDQLPLLTTIGLLLAVIALCWSLIRDR